VKISAVINTYNEEKNLERALRSLVWAEEIIVVDMESTDKTLEIAAKFNAKVYSHPYVGYVEPARNLGLEKANGDWIFILDADEEATLLLGKKLRQLSENIEGKTYFRLPRKNILFDKWIQHTGWWPDYQIRFFRKGSVTWGDEIHSIPETRGKGEDIPASEENALIHHNYQTVEQFVTRMNRYTTIEARLLYNQKQPFEWKKLIERSIGEFLGRYFAGEGYKDGVHGLGLSLLQSFYQVLVQLKLWQAYKFEEKQVGLADSEKVITSSLGELKYWIDNKKIEEEKGQLKKNILKLKSRLPLNL